MNPLFDTLGKIAGLGGLSLGILLTIFIKIIGKNIFPALNNEHSFRIIRLIIVLTFIISFSGLVMWFVLSLFPAESKLKTQDSTAVSKTNPDTLSKPYHHTTATPPQKPKSSNPIISDIHVTEAKINFNDFISDTTQKNDVGVVILDQDSQPLSSVAAQISTFYRNQGLTVTSPVFNYAFFKSQYFKSLKNADRSIIDKLSLASHLKYLIIGKYTNTIENGADTKYISRASLDVSIISCVAKSETDAFKINVANGYDDKQNAEAGAIEKLISNYKINHLNNKL